MDYARTVVEEVLRGTHMSKPSLDRMALANLADYVRDSCGMALCASPYAIAEALGVNIVDVALPRPVSICVADADVIVRPVSDLREHGLLVFRGLARYTLGLHVGAHTEADAVILAAELAAPSGLVERRGIEVVAMCQHWVPMWFLDAWDEHLCPPVSTSRTA